VCGLAAVCDVPLGRLATTGCGLRALCSLRFVVRRVSEVVLSTVLLPTVIVGCDAPEPQHAMPRNEAHIFDFGTILPGSVSKHTFPIPNSTQRDISVDSITTSCSCAVVDHTGSPISPGVSGRFTVSFRAPQRSGDVQQNLVLKFVDNALPPLQYRIRARVRSPLEVAPERIVVTGLPKGSQQVERIQIKKYGQGKWADCHLRTSVPWIRPLSAYELPTPNPSPESPTQLFEASLAIETALLNPGTHTAFVEVHLSEASEDSEVLQLPVRVSVTGKAVAVPETLFFGRVHEATAASARVEVVLQEVTILCDTDSDESSNCRQPKELVVAIHYFIA
jgi:hypothetical protein